MIGRSLALLAVIVSCLLGSACGLTHHSGDVFVPYQGMSFRFPVRNHEILDLGVSQLHNKSDDPVRITGVKLMDVPAAMHQGRVDAFTYEQTQSGVYGELGDLPERCPKVFIPLHRPYPVIGAGRDARYYLTVQVRIHRLGTYKVDSAQVSYLDLKTHESGAQVMHLNVTVRVKAGRARFFPQSSCGPSKQHPQHK